MSDSKFTNSSTKLNNAATTLSVATRYKRIIIGVLLVVLSLVVITIVKKILRVPIPHNSIIVGGFRRVPSIIPLLILNSMQYTFSIDESKIIDSDLPKNLGDEPEWSPDGQWVVSSAERVDNGSGIYIMRADGSQRTLVPIPCRGFQPTWSPDGKQITYYASNARQCESGIYITNIECLLRGESCTPEFRLVFESGGYGDLSPDWSPDGKQIIYSKHIDVYISHIFAINTDRKSQSIDLTPYYSGAITQPRWSPDGTKIVAVCWSKISASSICVMNKDGSNLRYLTHTNQAIDYPRWSPDGQQIAYLLDFSNKPMEGACWEGCPRPNAVYIINTNGDDITHLPLEDNVLIKWFTWYP